MTTTSWDPALYLTFDEHRARPFHDLLARVGSESPRRVVDLGCGPAHLTGLLAARWPDALVDAMDSSPEMVAAARANGVHAELGDVVDWSPKADTDVVVCSAVLHWVPTHPELLPRWIAALPAGAWFALQVPGNFDEPSHTLANELAAEAEWRDRLPATHVPTVLAPTEYAELLTAAGAKVDAWESTYIHQLTGEDAVLRWISGTSLRPVRDALGEQDFARFAGQLAPRLRAAYPVAPSGDTWFPFRRVFAVAHKSAA